MTRPINAEPYAIVTRRKRVFRPDAFQIYVPSITGQYEFDTAQSLTDFLARHLPGRSVLWDI